MNERLLKSMLADGFDVLILCQSDNVAYTTGYEPPLPYCAADNVVNAPYAFSVIDAKEQSVTLIGCSFGCGDAKALSFADEVIIYNNFDFFEDIDSRKEMGKAIGEQLKKHLKGAKKVGIEETRLPVYVYRLIEQSAPGAEIAEAQQVLDYSRMVKQPWEIERIQYSCKIEDVGQETLRNYALNFSEGITEFEVYSGVLTNMYRAHGSRVTLTGDLATGPRIREIAGVKGPISRTIQRGDLGIFDMSIRVNGYWCDCSNTVVFGKEPSEEQLHYFKMVKEAFYAGFEKMVPGNRLYDVDKATADVFRAYGMEPIVYTGHQIGCNVNEVPRILSYTDKNIIIEPNMVVCLEPQNYSNDNGLTGVRLERVVQATESGPVALNEFQWGIDV